MTTPEYCRHGANPECWRCWTSRPAPHARPMAEARRAERIRYAVGIARDAAILAAILAALLAVITYAGPAPY